MSPLIALLLSLPPGGDNILRNGDFEAGGRDTPAIWMRVQPPAEEARFEHPEEGAHGGKSCGLLTTTKGAGYSSFTQRIDAPPRKATVLRLAGWIRADELAEGAAASLLVAFDAPDNPAAGGVHETPRVTETGDWTFVETEIAVPEGARSWLVRCGLRGVGRVAFDDVEVTWSKEKSLVETKLAIHHGTFRVEAKSKSKKPWMRFSIPFPFEGQTPLAIRVTSDPPGKVAALAVAEDKENRPLEVRFVALERGEKVRLRAETLVMVRDRPLADGSEVDLAKKSKVPKNVRQHLKPAPGVDVKDETVAGAAKELDRSDLKSLTDDVNEFLAEKLTYDGGEDQGAEKCLELGKAVCTGYANVAASLLIAADVPTRILACTQLSGRLQEHYIVEVWTPELGWSRLESTMARFPWADSNNLIVRVVYPDSSRSRINVPLYSETGGGVTGGFDMGDDTCWQGADMVGSFLVGEKELAAIETAARGAFESLLKKPGEGAQVRLTPEKPPSKVKERGQRILATVADFESDR